MLVLGLLGISTNKSHVWSLNYWTLYLCWSSEPSQCPLYVTALRQTHIQCIIKALNTCQPAYSYLRNLLTYIKDNMLDMFMVFGNRPIYMAQYYANIDAHILVCARCWIWVLLNCNAYLFLLCSSPGEEHMLTLLNSIDLKHWDRWADLTMVDYKYVMSDHKGSTQR